MPANITPLISRLVSDVRFRSSVSDEKVLLTAEEISDIITQQNKGQPAAPSMATKVLAFVKPTLVFNTPGGERIWAPYGEAKLGEASLFKGRLKLAIGSAALLLFLAGFGVGRLTKK